MQLNTQKYQQIMRLVVSVGNHYQRMLEFEVASPKLVYVTIKCSISKNRWIRPKTGLKAVQ